MRNIPTYILYNICVKKARLFLAYSDFFYKLFIAQVANSGWNRIFL